jgi:hypothetical protein
MTPEERAEAVMLATKLAGHRCVDEGGMKEAIAAAIREAVAAERERCAEVADNCYAMLIGHANHSYGENAESLALDIARAIREGK